MPEHDVRSDAIPRTVWMRAAQIMRLRPPIHAPPGLHVPRTLLRHSLLHHGAHSLGALRPHILGRHLQLPRIGQPSGLASLLRAGGRLLVRYRSCQGDGLEDNVHGSALLPPHFLRVMACVSCLGVGLDVCFHFQDLANNPCPSISSLTIAI